MNVRNDLHVHFPTLTWQSRDLSDIPRFQNSPNLSKIEKVAETCEFDGKEPLFVERTIAISNKEFWDEFGS